MKKDFKIITYNLKNNDKDKLISSYLELFNDINNIKYLSFTSIPFTQELVNIFVTTADKDGVTYLTALDEKKIIGILIIKEFQIEGFEILGLCVHFEYRNKGIGRQLLREAENRAKKNGYKSIKVSVFTDNKNMLRLLIKLDYIPSKLQYHMRFDGMDILELIKAL